LDFLTTGFLQGGLSTPRPTPNPEDQAPYLWPPVTGWPSYSPRHPLQSPFTTWMGYSDTILILRSPHGEKISK
jgi:hypothetical protein